MKRVVFLTMAVVAVLVVVGGGLAYRFFSMQDRGMTRDGRMAPPASVRNAPEAPKFDAAKKDMPVKTADQPLEYQLPTEFKLPTDLDISAPKVPDGIVAPSDGEKT
jgi:hypothetical protein